MEKRTDILFDLDGTLTDPMQGITKSVRYALRYFGIEPESLESLTPFIGPPLKGSFEKFYGFSEDKAELALAKYREYFSVTGIFENEVYRGIPSMLKTLKESGKRLYLATSKPLVFAERILKHFHLDVYFDYVGGSMLDGRRVEKKEVIEHVLQRRDIDPLSAVMVGDRKFDIEGAHAVGLAAIGVLYGYGDRDELCAAGADALVSDVAELSAMLTA